MKKNILWIEDAASGDLSELSAYVNSLGKYDLNVALNVSQGLFHLLQKEYDAIVVDIRITPGEENSWSELYYTLGGSPTSAKLGLHLLYSIFKHPNSKIIIDQVPSWITTGRFGVLTVERGLADHMKILNINTYMVKSPSESDETALSKVIELILESYTSPTA